MATNKKSDQSPVTQPASDAVAPTKTSTARAAGKKTARKVAKPAKAAKKASRKISAKRVAKKAAQPAAAVKSTAKPRRAKKAAPAAKRARKQVTPASTVAASVNPDLDRALQLVEQRQRDLEQLRLEAERIEVADTQRRLALVRAELPLIVGKISDSERRGLIAQLQGKAESKVGTRKGRMAKRGGKGKAKGKGRAKYRLPTGETWSGMGPRPKTFKAWQAENPGKDFPLA